MAKKLGCASCGGTMKKMKAGGSAVAKAPVNMYGIPQENMGTSSQMGFGRKGGVVKKTLVKKPLVKAQKGITTGKPTYSSNSFSKKSYVDPTSKDRYTNSYGADKKGIVRSKRLGLENATTIGGKSAVSLPEKNTSMDTTGYSKGKSTFTIKQLKTNSTDGGYNPNTGKFGSSSYNEWDIPRSKVKATIAQMKKGTGMAKKETVAKNKSKKK